MPRADRDPIFRPGATHTRCMVEFHSDDNPEGGQALYIGGDHGDNPLMGRLVGVHTHKDFAAASGTFNITIKKEQKKFPGSRSMLRLWPEAEGVWVKITWLVDGQAIDGMFGTIDSVQSSQVRGPDGARTETYTILGRDIGKIFEQTEVWLFPSDFGRVARSMLAYTEQVLPKLLGPPSKIIRVLLEAWIGNYQLGEQQWRLPKTLGGGSFFETLETDLTIENMELDEGHGIINGIRQIPIDGAGDLWGVLQEYSNDVLNEMWVDLAPGPLDDPHFDMVPAFYFRERPFPTRISGSQKWNQIKMHFLDRADVRDRNVSVGGAANRYNVWLLEMMGPANTHAAAIATSNVVDGAKAGEPGSLVIANMSSIQRHGVRKWQRGTRALPFDRLEDADQWATTGVQWLRRIHDWYSVAPFQHSGSITSSRMYPEIRVGQRIQEDRDEGSITYYCEGVDNRWQYPNAGASTFTVTRGTYDGENPLEKVYEQIQNPPDALTALQACFVDDTITDPNNPNYEKNVDAFFDRLGRQDCKFEPTGGEVLQAGDVGAGTEDFTIDELVSEGAGRAPEDRRIGGPQTEMIPLPDAENAQAAEIAGGNVGATATHPPAPVFGPEELARGDAPLADLDIVSPDPLLGIIQQ